jgi:hypothetical protein
MTVICSEFIPRKKFAQFNEVLRATNGRYLANPFECGDTVHVRYEQGADHEKTWGLYTEDITEVRKDQKWRIFLRKLGLIK